MLSPDLMALLLHSFPDSLATVVCTFPTVSRVGRCGSTPRVRQIYFRASLGRRLQQTKSIGRSLAGLLNVLSMVYRTVVICG